VVLSCVCVRGGGRGGVGMILKSEGGGSCWTAKCLVCLGYCLKWASFLDGLISSSRGFKGVAQVTTQFSPAQKAPRFPQDLIVAAPTPAAVVVAAAVQGVSPPQGVHAVISLPQGSSRHTTGGSTGGNSSSRPNKHAPRQQQHCCHCCRCCCHWDQLE